MASLTSAEINLALERFHLAEEAEAQNRRDSLDDWQFSIGNQWSADIETQRTQDGKPCLTMDHIGPAMKLITNEQRQQRPAGQVNPVGQGSDKETAEILEGIVRHIEVISDGEIAYDNAFDHMMRGGFGFWRMVTEYVDDKSFDQEIKIKPIQNPFAVHFDPFSIEPDHSDADFAFVFEDIGIGEYKRLYPKSDAASMADFNAVGDMGQGWFTKDTVRVADYFHVEYETHKLAKLSDGSVARDGVMLSGSTATVVSEREVQERKVIWSKINAVEELEQTAWPGKFIPIIPVYGVDLVVDGKRYLAGMVRGAKDPQRMYNYWASAITQAIALAPAAPWVVAEGQIEGHEDEWAVSNTRAQILTYKTQDVGGKPVPPPIRNSVEPPIQAMMVALRQADQDLKSSTLIYDPSLGENPKDQSGKAISLLQRQGQVGNINWTDNLSRSIRHSTRAILDLIPHIYDAPRVQRIVNPDGSTDHVGVYNSQTQQQGTDPKQILMQQGMKKVYDLGVGQYDVVVNVGPSYQSKRQEALASQLQLISEFPQIMPIAGDILVRNFDWPEAEEIADRLKKALPPNLQDNDDPNATLQQTQAQLAQLGQQHAQVVQALQQANQIIETKKVEGDYKVQIALIDERVKIAVAEINASKDRDKAAGDRILAELEMGHDAAHEAGMQAVEHSHQTQQAQQQQQFAAQQAAQQPQGGQATQ